MRFFLIGNNIQISITKPSNKLHRFCHIRKPHLDRIFFVYYTVFKAFEFLGSLGYWISNGSQESGGFFFVSVRDTMVCFSKQIYSLHALNGTQIHPPNRIPG